MDKYPGTWTCYCLCNRKDDCVQVHTQMCSFSVCLVTKSKHSGLEDFYFSLTFALNWSLRVWARALLKAVKKIPLLREHLIYIFLPTHFSTWTTHKVCICICWMQHENMNKNGWWHKLFVVLPTKNSRSLKKGNQAQVQYCPDFGSRDFWRRLKLTGRKEDRTTILQY